MPTCSGIVMRSPDHRRCTFPAKFPVDAPKYCGFHYRNHMDTDKRETLRCTHLTKDLEPCKNDRMIGSKFCFAHGPVFGTSRMHIPVFNTSHDHPSVFGVPNEFVPAFGAQLPSDSSSNCATQTDSMPETVDVPVIPRVVHVQKKKRFFKRLFVAKK